MSRSRGTYSTLENWALDVAPTLPGAAGWVLLKLAAQVNYKRKTMTIGQLIDALPYKERTLQQACAFLVQEGYVLCAGNEYLLRGTCTELAQALRKNAHPGQGVNNDQDSKTPSRNSGITQHNKKESEGREEKELKEKNTQHAHAPEEPGEQTPNPTGQGTPDPAQVDQSPGGNVNTQATSKEDVPPGPPEQFTSTPQLLTQVFGALLKTFQADPAAPLGVNRAQWNTIPLTEARNLLGQAKTSAAQSGRQVTTEFRKLLDATVQGHDIEQPRPAPASSASTPETTTAAPPTLVEGEAVTFKGNPYHIARITRTVIELQDAEGITTKVFRSNKADMNAIQITPVARSA